MIHFDVTKSGAARHQSGLMRISARLRDELGAIASPVCWEPRRGAWLLAGTRAAARFSQADWLLTTELFSEQERPGFWRFLHARPCRLAAMFADAIPLRYPQITWPQSVARHPEYMKMLAAFDRVWAISEASRRDLLGFWSWQGGTVRAAVETIMLGADFDRQPRTPPPADPPAPEVLCVGILEPRKNQTFLLDVCEELWAAGMEFDLHVVGRVNPHFGGPVVARLKAMMKAQPRAHYHDAPTDERLESLFAAARVSAFPSIAEGCGLPVLESLWKGRPCVCSDIPVLREIADGGGCVVAAPDDRNAWAGALRMALTDDAGWRQLAAEVGSRALPVWADTARVLIAGMG